MGCTRIFACCESKHIANSCSSSNSKKRGEIWRNKNFPFFLPTMVGPWKSPVVERKATYHDWKPRLLVLRESFATYMRGKCLTRFCKSSEGEDNDNNNKWPGSNLSVMLWWNGEEDLRSTQAVPHGLRIISVSVRSFLCKTAVFEGGSFGRLVQDWSGGAQTARGSEQLDTRDGRAGGDINQFTETIHS